MNRIGVLLFIPLLLGQSAPPAAVKGAEVEMKIRKTLAGWVVANNARDNVAANRVWAPGVKGVFPNAPEFSNKTAAKIAGVPDADQKLAWSTFELTVNEVLVSDDMAVVNDRWIETIHFAGTTATAKRILPSFEVWRPQPDGEWRIVRWISAPEPWTR